MLPDDKLDAVTRGLNEAFGVAEVDDIRDLTDRPGSNRAFRILVRGAPYLLRINTRPGDTARHFACMQAAAEAGLAPRVFYANAEDRLSITDFVNAVPLSAADALRRVPAALRVLHALPPFPASPWNTTCTFLLNKGPALDGMLGQFRAAHILPESELEELLAHHARIVKTISSLDPDPAPCHNDLFKPDNMVLDGTRLWLVDWEAAFQNDRYADLAVVANMLVSNEAEEQIFLQQYFGLPASPYQAARLFVMRQLAHIFYAIVFLSMGAAGRPVDWSEPVLGFHDFQRRFWSREIDLADNDSKLLAGRVHWEELRQNLRQPRFEEALKILGRTTA